ncbi:MAG TPA: hypothetical protein VNT54_11055 [Solirubrobacteraceae bacterium]|nr:hypothetical protein [Solirubrobacteraceae bacterium]
MSPARNLLAASAIAAALYALFGHAFLNYDSFFTLVWGDDLAAGRLPDYEVPVAPTPHPLATATGALLSVFGDSAEDLFLAIVLLSMGAIGLGLHRLGSELFAPAVGILAAAIFLTRVPPLNFGIRGYVDLPTVALVVWAAVLEARRPRRGAAVLVLLALAGLLRPEAWLFAGVYWLWLRAPLRLLPLAAAAPLTWALSDLLVTGDPLWSLNGTTDLAAELGRRTGLGAVPEVMPRRLGEIMRLPELVAAVAGAGAGVLWLRSRVGVPLAVACLNGVGFLVLAVAGLPLLGRYLFLAAAMLSVLAGAGALGWLALPDGPERRRWRAGGLALLAAIGLLFAVQQVDRIADLRADIADRDRVQADLRDLVRGERADAALAGCGTLFVPNHRPVPSLAYWLDRRPRSIVSAARTAPAADGAFLAPTPEAEPLSILDPKDATRPATDVPPGYALAAENRSWRLYRGPACR